MSSRISVMCTASSRTPSAVMTSRSRSWVSGRTVCTPCCWNAIAEASTAPIQIGRYRTPSSSRSNTTGWFAGSSTRTPTTRSGCTTATSLTRADAATVPPLVAVVETTRCRKGAAVGTIKQRAGCGVRSGAADNLAQADLDERGVQPHRQRGELTNGLLRARFGLAAALAADRSDDLREQPDLAVGRGAKRAQVPAFEAIARQLARDLRYRERVVVVVAAWFARDQAELFELGQLLGAQARSVEQLFLRQPHRGRRRPEVVGGGRVPLDRRDLQM